MPENEQQRQQETHQTGRRQELFEQFFNSWEKRTSEYFEKLLRNPSFLGAMGGMMNTGYRNKIQFDRAMTALWKSLNLPNKADQERTLHLLNELHGRIFDLEEKVSQLTEENQRLKDDAAGDNRPKARRTAGASSLRTAGAE